MNTLCGRQVLVGKDADDAVNAHMQEGIQIKPITVGKRSPVQPQVDKLSDVM